MPPVQRAPLFNVQRAAYWRAGSDADDAAHAAGSGRVVRDESASCYLFLILRFSRPTPGAGRRRLRRRIRRPGHRRPARHGNRGSRSPQDGSFFSDCAALHHLKNEKKNT